MRRQSAKSCNPSPAISTDDSSDSDRGSPRKYSANRSSAKTSQSFDRLIPVTSKGAEQRSFDLGPNSSRPASASRPGTGTSGLFAPPPTPTPKMNAPRKRPHPSALNMSTSMRQSPYENTKTSKLDESFSSDFFSDTDDEYSVGNNRVSQILGKLGTELQQKLRAKKHRIEEQFKAIKALPPVLLTARQRHAEERQKLLDSLQVESGKIEERLENIAHLVSVQYEKHQKSLEVITKGSEEVHKTIEACINAQSSLYIKFAEDMKKLDQQHLEGINGLEHRCDLVLRQLHGRLGNNLVQAELDNLSKIKS